MKTRFLLALCATLLALVWVAQADTITIENPDFSSPGCAAPGPSVCGPPTDWTVSGSAGNFLPAPTDTQAFAGAQYAYANEGGSLTQDLLTALLANTTYTFTVWELWRNGASFTGAVELVAGGTDVLADATGTPFQGSWEQFTLTYTSPGSGSPIGEDLSVVLTSTGIQGDFDALSDITTTTVPEPSTMVLLGTGLLALRVARRRRAYPLVTSI